MTAPATAAAVAGGLESNFGTFTLSPGFEPDPHTIAGTSGGAINANTKSPECTGWISQTPDHIFMAQQPFPSIKVIANGGDQDLTMVLQKPDGTFMCNDDGDGGLLGAVLGRSTARLQACGPRSSTAPERHLFGDLR